MLQSFKISVRRKEKGFWKFKRNLLFSYFLNILHVSICFLFICLSFSLWTELGTPFCHLLTPAPGAEGQYEASLRNTRDMAWHGCCAIPRFSWVPKYGPVWLCVSWADCLATNWPRQEWLEESIVYLYMLVCYLHRQAKDKVEIGRAMRAVGCTTWSQREETR